LTILRPIIGRKLSPTSLKYPRKRAGVSRKKSGDFGAFSTAFSAFSGDFGSDMAGF
jgi:hypothetical protein